MFPNATTKIATLVLRARFLFFFILLGLTALSLPIAKKIAFDSNFESLLPEDDPVLNEVQQVRDDVGGLSELVAAIRGPEIETIDIADKLVRALRTHPTIARADYEFPADFILDRQLWLIPIDQLKQFDADIQKSVNEAKLKKNPLYIDLESDDDENVGDPKDDILETVYKKIESESAKRKYIQKYFYTKNEHRLIVRIRPKSGVADFDRSAKVIALVKKTMSELIADKTKIDVKYAGNIVSQKFLQTRMQSDFARASIVALVLVLAILSLFTRRIVTVLILAIPLICSLVITIAIAQIIFGRFNLVSGFLIAALVGLGIDFGIHLYLRYLNELAHSDPHEALRSSIMNVLPGSATGALTTCAAFLAMTYSDFAGFREFGYIAAFGVLIALICTYFGVPTLLILVRKTTVRKTEEKYAPLSNDSPESRGQKSISRVIAAYRRPIFAVTIAMSLLSICVLPWVELSNDFSKLRGKSDLFDLNTDINGSVGGSLNPAAIIFQSLSDERIASNYIRSIISDPNNHLRRFVSPSSLLPTDIPDRQAIISKMKKLLDRASDESRKDPRFAKLERILGTKPWSQEDIPTLYQERLFAKRSGKPMLLLWPKLQLRLEANLIIWEKTLTKIRSDLQKKQVPIKIGDPNRMAARVLATIRHDGPIILIVAFLIVSLLVLIDFRNLKKTALISASVGLSVLWLLGSTVFVDLDINVFNQALLPSILGLGIDNAIHIMHHHQQPGATYAHAMRTPGRASFLASATTMAGFGALIVANHYGVRSMGLLSIFGVTITFICTTILLPLCLKWKN